MAHYDFRPQGVCARALSFDLEDDKLHNVSFMGGCNGNLKAIGRLIEGMPAQQVVDLLEGNTCGPRPTSCADQLTKAISQARLQEA